MDKDKLSEVIGKVYDKEAQYFAEIQNTTREEGGFNRNSLFELGFLLDKFAKPNMKVAEIGSWTGFSTSVLANLVKQYNGKLYAIDWFKGSPESNLIELRFIPARLVLDYNLKMFDVAGNVEVMETTSAEAVKSFDDESLDFVFIDGDHRYVGVKQDIDLWFPKVKVGGILSGHDCEYLVHSYEELFSKALEKDFFQAHVGVIKAVVEKFSSYNRTGDGNIWWIQKG